MSLVDCFVFLFCLVLSDGSSNISNITSTAIMTTTSKQTTTYIPTTTAICSNGECCSAIQSYVEYFTNNETHTALSARVHWTPYQYYIQKANVVYFNTTNNQDACNASLIYQNVLNKIVLIRQNYNLYNCSEQLWVINLENNGAAGVLIWSQLLENIVFEEDGDNNIDNPSIPSRSISYKDGNIMYNNTMNNNDVFVTFGCFNDTFPSTICISNTGVGPSFIIDGEYQREVTITYNDHPVWFKEAYGGAVGFANFLYLLTDNEQGWIWIVSPGLGLVSTFSEIQNGKYNADAYCVISNTSTSDPASCHDWYVYNGSDIWTNVDYVSSTDGVCDILGDIFLCIKTFAPDTLPYESFVGTYYQEHQASPRWFKSIDPLVNNDTTGFVIQAGCVFFADFTCSHIGWLAYEVNKNIPYAFCVFDFAIIGWTTEDMFNVHSCQDWFVIDPITTVISYDEYIDVDEGLCNGIIDPNNTTLVYPETLCISSPDYSMFQRFYGTWTILPNVTHIHKPVWQIDDSYYNYTLIFSDLDDTWQITNGIPTTVLYDVYGICRTIINPDTPLNCTEGFSFITSPITIFSTLTVTVSEYSNGDTCFPVHSEEGNVKDIPNEVCIDINLNNVATNTINASMVQTRYYKQTDLYNGRVYFKQNNRDFYIYYNDFTRLWIVDAVLDRDYHNLDTKISFFCDAYNLLNPVACGFNWATNDINLVQGVGLFEGGYVCSFLFPTGLCSNYLTPGDVYIHACPPTTAPSISPTITPTISPTITPTISTTTTLSTPSSVSPTSSPISPTVNSSANITTNQRNGIIVGASIGLFCLMCLLIICCKLQSNGSTNKGIGPSFDPTFNEREKQTEMGANNKSLALPTTDNFGASIPKDMNDNDKNPFTGGAATAQPIDDDNDNDKNDANDAENPFATKGENKPDDKWESNF